VFGRTCGGTWVGVPVMPARSMVQVRFGSPCTHDARADTTRSRPRVLPALHPRLQRLSVSGEVTIPGWLLRYRSAPPGTHTLSSSPLQHLQHTMASARLWRPAFRPRPDPPRPAPDARRPPLHFVVRQAPRREGTRTGSSGSGNP